MNSVSPENIYVCILNTCCCQDNSLLLNVSSILEMIVDFGKKQERICAPLISTGRWWRESTALSTMVSTSVRVWSGCCILTRGQKGKEETISPQALEEIQSVPPNTDGFLQHREYPQKEQLDLNHPDDRLCPAVIGKKLPHTLDWVSTFSDLFVVLCPDKQQIFVHCV